MAITKSTVIKLILKYIGGAPLMQVPTSTIGGAPIAARAGALVGAAAGVASQVSSLASQAGALQAGLSAISQNPLNNLIGPITDKLENLTAGGFSGLASSIPSVAGNPALATQYDKFKSAIGGADGLGGAAAQIKKFREHTDRLSGLIPSSDSTG